MSKEKIVKTDVGSKTGQNKCPKCGATEISLNQKKGKLVCHFCRHEFDPEKVEGLEKSKALEGKIIASGAVDIDKDASDTVTLKCTSCGAEVVVDTSSITQARCHWCRNTLSINEQIPNGSVPDVVLPFKTEKEDAKTKIKEFVGKRKFYAHPKFKKEFTVDNIMGVYLPYMLVDVNLHANLKGKGEHQTRTYTRGTGDDKKRYYDADLYDVERDFDLTIDDLTIESSTDKLNTRSNKTNNIINSILPFDTENCVKYDSNYIRGFTSEKRDTNISDLSNIAVMQSKDVARFAANDSLEHYDRGVAWSEENVEVKGEQWKAAYLPVWLYSYMQKKGNKQLLHYVAVNARTNETMGSVPIHYPKLLFISSLIEMVCIYLTYLCSIGADSDDSNGYLFLLLGGIIYFLIIYAKYRNTGARHMHESETKNELSNLKKKDVFVKREIGLTNSMISGVNNKNVTGSIVSNNFTKDILDSVKKELK